MSPHHAKLHTILNCDLLFLFRRPAIPVSSFCGNVFCELVEGINEEGLPVGLKFSLLTDGKSYSCPTFG